MKIILVGPGIMPIPPIGWGAVESLIWDYYEILSRKGHTVSIINNPDRNSIITQCNQQNPDFVHIHYDVFYDIIPNIKCKNVAISSHYPYVDQLHKHKADGYDVIFKYIINNKNFYVFSVSKKDHSTFLMHGANPNKLFLMENGANENNFVFDEKVTYDKSVYLAKIEKRKRQYLFQSISNIDFIGKYQDTSFNTKNSNYLGEITPREKLFNLLTKYGNLVLLSEGENGSPLVIKEALISGLGVVTSEFASSELDTTKPFICVIPETKIFDLDYVEREIIKNRMISTTMRKEIREYGLTNFSWNKLIDIYENNLKKICE